MALTEVQINDLSMRLPERFQDRLPPTELEWAISARNAGEWGDELVDLLFALDKYQVAISSREAQDLRDLLETFRPGWIRSETGARLAADATRQLDSLTVTPSLTEEELVSLLRSMADRYRSRMPDQAVELITLEPEDETEGLWWTWVDVLVDTLSRHQVPISTKERDEISLMLDSVRLPRTRLQELVVR